MSTTPNSVCVFYKTKRARADYFPSRCAFPFIPHAAPVRVVLSGCADTTNEMKQMYTHTV